MLLRLILDGTVVPVRLDRKATSIRKAFIRKWRLKHRAVADSLEEAGDRLFTFIQLPPSQWRSARTTMRGAAGKRN